MANITKIKLPDGGTYDVKDTVSGYTSNTGTITSVKTTAGAHTTINKTSGAAEFNVPTKTSHLTNDSGFLTSHQTIKQDGVTGATVNRFGTCGTAAATAAKTVDITTGTFSLEAGATVAVKFTNANTASTPTLNVNSKGAKNIFVNGVQITTGGNKALLAGTVTFIYDGTQWNLIGNYYDTDTHSVTGVKGNSESSYRTGNVNITAGNIGLGNVENKSSATIRGELTSSNVTTALGYTPYNSTNPNGYTSNTGTVTSVKVGTTSYDPSSGVVSLPAYPTSLPASDTTSTYSSTGTAPVNGKAVASAIGGLDVTGASNIGAGKTISAWSETDGKVSISTQDINGSTVINNLTTGDSNAQRADYIVAQYAGGGTSTTTYHRRPLSKIFAALNSSDITTALGYTPYNSTNPNGYTSNTGTITGIKMNGASKGTSGVVDLGTVITSHQDISGKADKSATVSTVTYDTTNKKITKTINGTTTDVVTASTLKTDMALNNVGNFKAVSTVASQGLTSTEQSNARANIGAGTSSLTIGTTATTAMAGNTAVNNVTQELSTSNVNYQILCSSSLSNTTGKTYKCDEITINPSKSELVVSGAKGSVSLNMSIGRSGFYDAPTGGNGNYIAIDPYNENRSYPSLQLGNINNTASISTEISNGYINLEGEPNNNNYYGTVTLNTSNGISSVRVGEYPSGTGDAYSLNIGSRDITLYGSTWDGTNTSLKTAITGKVSKSGDTMTGNLTIRTTNTEAQVIAECADSQIRAYLFSNADGDIGIWGKDYQDADISVIMKKSNGELRIYGDTYSVAHPDKFRSAISAVNKGGDTMTGALKVQNAGLSRICTGVTLGKTANNGVTSNQYPLIDIQDSAGVFVGGLRTTCWTSGDVGVDIVARNVTTSGDGTPFENHIRILAKKDGSKKYEVSDPANFRSAIGLTEESWTNVNSNKQSYRKYHNVVYIRDHNSSTALTTSYTTLFTLPTGYRPTKEIYFAVNGKSNGTVAVIKITTGGVVSAMTLVGTASLWGFQISFLLG